jgi:hypothetical protein
MIMTLEEEFPKLVDRIRRLTSTDPVAAFRRTDTLLRWTRRMPMADPSAAQRLAWMSLAIACAVSDARHVA